MLDIYVYNEAFKLIGVLDNYESLIWTERYSEYGDFEIYTSADSGVLNWIKRDYYLSIRTSDKIMVVEEFGIDVDEDGAKLTISGRSLESILDRRIVWGQQTFDEQSLQARVKALITDAFISPSQSTLSYRIVEDFYFEESDDEAITIPTVDAVQYNGDNIYDVVKSICDTENIGFRITVDDNGQMTFKMYSGVDRSYSQTSTPYVVFSPRFDNLASSNYTESQQEMKNLVLVGATVNEEFTKSGETVTVSQSVWCPYPEGTSTASEIQGLSRREMYEDVGDLTGETVTSTEELKAYYTQMMQRGKEILTDYKLKKELEGEANTESIYKIGTDFNLGDIVEVEDQFGNETRCRINEIVTSVDTSSISTYPTFEIQEDEEDETTE